MLDSFPKGNYQIFPCNVHRKWQCDILDCILSLWKATPEPNFLKVPENAPSECNAQKFNGQLTLVQAYQEGELTEDQKFDGQQTNGKLGKVNFHHDSSASPLEGRKCLELATPAHFSPFKKESATLAFLTTFPFNYIIQVHLWVWCSTFFDNSLLERIWLWYISLLANTHSPLSPLLLHLCNILMAAYIYNYMKGKSQSPSNEFLKSARPLD